MSMKSMKKTGVAMSTLAQSAVTPDKLATGAATAYTSSPGTTTSTSLTTTLGGSPGTNPSVTVDIGANGLALVVIYAAIFNSAGGNSNNMAFGVSGENVIAADYHNGISSYGTLTNRVGGTFLLTGLEPGSTTFTLYYRVSGGTGTFSDRKISVVPL